MNADTTPFGPSAAKTVRRFFAQEPTPMVMMHDLAKSLNVAGVYVKDESQRLGQQAFKVYGAAFAMATYIAKHIGVSIEDVNSFERLRAAYTEKCGATPITFVTCTDGNHGRAVAWAAKQLGQKAVVYMPKGSAPARVAHVRGNGGLCTVTDLNYDDTVEVAFAKAKEHGWTVLQDTTAPGYTEIPTWIMQGYTAMVDEALEQMAALDGGAVPSHIFLQCGVGSMAGAVLGYFVERSWAERTKRPVTCIMEPKNAACAFVSAELRDGSMGSVGGNLETMIAGLACGVLSDIGWPILAKYTDGGFFWVDDTLAGNGMRAMQREGVEAGECGGIGVGLIQRLLKPGAPDGKSKQERLGLGPNSRILIFNTEGATDPENYQKQMNLPDARPVLGDFGFAPPLPIAVSDVDHMRSRL